MKRLLFAMCLGAALAWAFDPISGARRRAEIRRKLEARHSAAPTSASPVIVPTVPSPDPLTTDTTFASKPAEVGVR